MTQILMIIMIINSALFTQSNHPMSMGMILLIQTILTCLITSIWAKNFWFSYILFLIFIGGMLILFIYMASLASNEKLNFSFFSWFNIKLLMIFLMILLIFDKFWFNSLFFNKEMEMMNNLFFMMKENFFPTSKMYDTPNNWIVIFLINYLLLNLIIIVKICNSFSGPLRSKN